MGSLSGSVFEMETDAAPERSSARSTVVVTGAAGFIGSRLCEVLLEQGRVVRGIDALTDYYDRNIKVRNLEICKSHDRFTWFERDLAVDAIDDIVEGADAVIHLAAMPGLVRSWTDVASYSRCNVVGTASLLEAVARVAPEARVLHVSTSSVYGLEATGDETSSLKPSSPYGITKLAAEQLVAAYRDHFGLEAVVLRYFSVYGPRQRPDMAYNIFCRLLLEGAEIPLFGDGSAVRTNTYVDDCVAGTIGAMDRARSGETYNLGGGVAITVNEAIALLSEVSGRPAKVKRFEPRRGDQLVTVANFSKATRHFGYQPAVAPVEGLAKQWEWHLAQTSSRS